MSEDKFDDYYQDIKRNVLKYRMVSLDILYFIIDKILYSGLKVYPERTSSYYRKHGRFIVKLENSGVITQLPYVQVWEVNKRETQ